MKRYILKRIILFLLTIIIVIIATFFLTRAISKTPNAIVDQISQRIQQSRNPNPQQITQAVYNEMGYHPDWSPFKAFGHYIKNIFQGNFGKYYAKPSGTLLYHFASPLKWTFLVSGLGFVFGTIIGLAFGIFAGYKRGKLPDILLNIIAIVFVAIPSFVLASFIALLASQSNWPIEFLGPALSNSFWKTFQTLIIPIGIITVTSFATITYYIRNEVVEVLKSDYVITARSKGLNEVQIFLKHVFRNISIPAVTIILPRFMFIIMGSFVIELFFQVPGAASMLSTAATTYEYNVIMFSVIFFTSLSLFLNIILDVIYSILDPRISLAEKSNRSFIRSLINKRLRKKDRVIKEIKNE